MIQLELVAIKTIKVVSAVEDIDLCFLGGHLELLTGRFQPTADNSGQQRSQDAGEYRLPRDCCVVCVVGTLVEQENGTRRPV